MDPSSLIFVVIVGIWAVYLVQHWVRRREQLVTSRSIDRFSQDLRILQRRVPAPLELPVRASRGYVVSPSASRAPEVAMPETSTTTTAAAANADVRRRPEPRTAERAGVAPEGRVPRPVTPRAGSRRSHRLRALTFLTLLVATPACWAAHEWGTLLLMPTLAVTAAFVLDLLYVRRVARVARGSRQHTRVAARPARAPRPEREAASPARVADQRLRRYAEEVVGTPASRPARRPVRAARATAADVVDVREARVTIEAEVDVIDVRTSTTGATAGLQASREALTEIIELPDGWQPVAVPRPTYTMKAKAPRASAPAGPLEADSDSSPARASAGAVLTPAVAVDDLELDAVLERRTATGA